MGRDRPWLGGVRVLAAGLVAAISTGCWGDDPRPAQPIYPGRLVVWPAQGGRIDLTELGGPLILRGGWAEVLVLDGAEERTVSTRSCAGGWEQQDAPPTSAPYFRGLRGFVWTCEQAPVALRWSVFQDTERDAAVLLLDVENRSSDEIVVLRTTPLISEGVDGGLFVGADPRRHRILDNGSAFALDVDVKLHDASEGRWPLLDAILPINSRGKVVSNWNHAIVDLDSSRSWVAGTLTTERAFPTMGTVFDPEEVVVDADGRQGFGAFIADGQLSFHGKPLAPGETLRSEVLYVNPVAPDAFRALEDYAEAVAAWLDFTAWTRRDGGRPLPNGWNSWSGSGSTGGLGTDIDETVMLENLEVMAREFEPFGIDYFQVDDGYQVADGDWFPHPDRFPSGMEALSGSIRDRGLTPGLWISGFTVNDSSQLAQEHPEWLANPESNVLGPLLQPDADDRVFDLSNPEVLAWLGETMKRFRDDWSMGWVKLDFAYLALPYPPRADDRLTAIEAYKKGIRAIQEALGDDVFYLGVALMGLNYGVVDGMRVTLDNGPRWEEEDAFAAFGEGSNFKTTVRTGARRYYLSERVWTTHDDLLFFRTDLTRPEPPVTMDEAITLASFMGLSASIVKFGEDLRTLTPEQVNVWRKLLPSYPVAARPMDLFTRHYPEQYLLPIDGTLAGSDARWWVVGLLNWGRNFDYDTMPPEEMADGPRRYTIDLGSWGLDGSAHYLASEFWTERFLGVVRGTLEHEVAAHGHAVIALREATGRPQLLGHNRQITQGATDLVEEVWDEDERSLRLTLVLDAAAPDAVPFEYRIRVYLPAGYALTAAQVGDGAVSEDGDQLIVTLQPASSGIYGMVLTF